MGRCRLPADPRAGRSPVVYAGELAIPPALEARPAFRPAAHDDRHGLSGCPGRQSLAIGGHLHTPRRWDPGRVVCFRSPLADPPVAAIPSAQAAIAGAGGQSDNGYVSRPALDTRQSLERIPRPALVAPGSGFPDTR